MRPAPTRVAGPPALEFAVRRAPGVAATLRPGPQGDGYAELKRRVRAAGLLDKRPHFYVLLIAVNTLLLVGGLAAMLAMTNPWIRILCALFLGLVSGQLGFQLHDAGHRQMFDRGWLNVLVGLVTADLLLGMSYGWWVSKHNAHHANPNDVDDDPDITAGALVYTREEALERRGVLRLLTAYQAFAFFPLLVLMGAAMHATSVAYLSGPGSRHRRLEVLALVCHGVLYLGFFVLVAGPLMGAVLVLVHQAAGSFYLASVFAPNHKGMPQTSAGARPGFLSSQVITARNVRSGRATDLMYGALNYQIEHHLFPAMPRSNMRKAQPIVRAYCAEVGLPYYETSIGGSYREILGFLHDVGAPLRRPRPGRPVEG